jgi:hypothetical protein
MGGSKRERDEMGGGGDQRAGVERWGKGEERGERREERGRDRETGGREEN